MDRIHVFRAPVDPQLRLVSPRPRDPAARSQVYWAGRLDRQKRVDLVLRIAALMPDGAIALCPQLCPPSR